MCVTSTALFDMPDFIIETLDPVSRIRLRSTTCISIEMQGVPCSNKTELKDVITAFAMVLKWRELFSLTSFAFPWFVFLSGALLVYERVLLPEEPERLKRSDGLHLPGGSKEVASLLSLVVHSLAKCHMPSNS